ncbi:MAG: DUF4397 domain-containing protein [Chlorobi bacterium]|nr:DUF4397 domain-containing protein [Chlorobiota bacterium]
MAHAARTSRDILIVALITLSFLTGCNDGVVTFAGGTAYVQVFNAQTKTSVPLRIIADSAVIVRSLSTGEFSQTFAVPSGTYVLLEAYTTGDTAAQRIASQRYVMADGQSYTVLIRGEVITDFLRPIVDTVVSPFPDRAAVKIINASEETFATIEANDTAIGLPIVDAQTILPLVPVQEGSVRFRVRDIDRNVLIGTDTTVVLERGKCYYLFIHDIRVNGNVQQRWFIRNVQ